MGLSFTPVIPRDGPEAARLWFDELLALSVLLGAIFAFLTLDELGVSSDWVALGGATVGALALAYGVRWGKRSVLLAGCLAIVVSVWVFAITQGGSLVAVGALALTAALLFWVSARLGRIRS